ncbi:MAG: ChbG/HpnK family deacetylase [Burkholderiales bacterium]|nr:ChbG/HpnK family deacetylase [Burkholderiales bacterium]
MNGTLALCADDFGLDRATSMTIAGLAAAGRLQAVSCLVNLACWRDCAPLLAALPAGVARGLHFNLTEGAPLSAALGRVWRAPPPLARLLGAAAFGRLPGAAIAAELDAQWRAFVDATGRPPDFVDGHQHVHALRGVRGAVLRRAAAAGVPVRSTGHVVGPGFAFKRRVIEACGGRALARALAAQGTAHNAVLVGVYDFGARDYRALMRGWLAALVARSSERPSERVALLFCHPGANGDASPHDAIASARRAEAAYLGSAAFADDLAQSGLTTAWPWRRSSAG